MKHHSSISKSNSLYTISIIGFLLALHIALPSYFNSSFLSKFTSEDNLSIIYMIASVISILGLLIINPILRKLGNYKTSLMFIGIQILIFYGILNLNSAIYIIPLIILSLALTALISFTFDIFLEKNTVLKDTGAIRGHYMTVINSAWILGPL